MSKGLGPQKVVTQPLSVTNSGLSASQSPAVPMPAQVDLLSALQLQRDHEEMKHSVSCRGGGVECVCPLSKLIMGGV